MEFLYVRAPLPNSAKRYNDVHSRKKKCGDSRKDFRRSLKFLSDLVKMQEIKTEASFHHKFTTLSTNRKLCACSSWIESDGIIYASLEFETRNLIYLF